MKSFVIGVLLAAIWLLLDLSLGPSSDAHGSDIRRLRRPDKGADLDVHDEESAKEPQQAKSAGEPAATSWIDSPLINATCMSATWIKSGCTWIESGSTWIMSVKNHSLEMVQKIRPPPWLRAVAIPRPPMPNVLNIVKLVTRLHYEVDPPPPWLPNLDELGQEVLVQRRDYFISAGLFMMAGFMLLGMGLTVLGSLVLEHRHGFVSHPEEYAPMTLVGESGHGEATQRLLHATVRLHFLAISVTLLICLQMQSFSSEYGAAWEFWLAWLAFCLTQGLVELLAVLFRGDRRAWNVYPLKMVSGHLPFLSEKADTLKDIVFCALAWHVGDVWLAVFSFGMLVVSHEIFLHMFEVQGELYDAYLPIFSSPPPGPETAVASASESNDVDGTPRNTDARGTRLGRLWSALLECRGGQRDCQVFVDALQAAVKEGPPQAVVESLMKQTSGSRLRIAIFEDVPQAMLAVLFLARNGSCKYVSGSFTLSVIRLAPSIPHVAEVVTWVLSAYVNAELVKSARARNIARLHEQLVRLYKPRSFRLEDVCRRLDEDMIKRLKLWLQMAVLLAFYFVGYMAWGFLSNVWQVVAAVLTMAPFLAALLYSAYYVLSTRNTVPDAKVLCSVICGALLFPFIVAFAMRSWFPLQLLGRGFMITIVGGAAVGALVICHISMTSSADKSKFKLESVALQDREQMVRLLKEIPVALGELKELGFGPAEIITVYQATKEDLTAACGFTEQDICSACQIAGMPAKKLHEMGFPEHVMKEAGWSLGELKAGGYGTDLESLDKLVAAGFNAEEMLAAGWSLEELKAAGYGSSMQQLERLVDAGFKAEQFEEAGWPLQHFKAAEYGGSMEQLEKLGHIGFTAQQFDAAGWSLEHLKAAGHGNNLEDLTKLMQIGFSAKEFQAVGWSLEQLQALGFGTTIPQLEGLVLVGFTATEFRDAGWSLEELKKAGFGTKAVHLQQLKNIGFTGDEMKAAGWNLKHLKEAGYGSNLEDLEKLMQLGFGRFEFEQVGWSLKELKALGYGSTAQQVHSLLKAEFTASKFKAADWSLEQLRAAGYGSEALHLQQLKEAGFTAREMKAAGFVLKDLQQAGYGAGEQVVAMVTNIF
eukprot:TRINITY_DN30794_c0_g1_i1.p1 TRINITY_DN30794_c0_g1~~TRINITY_DN30794_c0_g1_i1.p1  ORF type:complete len:1100 (-),score=146.80 TRINITY_DN30794_c0_g1_i1:289-3588(-)